MSEVVNMCIYQPQYVPPRGAIRLAEELVPPDQYVPSAARAWEYRSALAAGLTDLDPEATYAWTFVEGGGGECFTGTDSATGAEIGARWSASLQRWLYEIEEAWHARLGGVKPSVTVNRNQLSAHLGRWTFHLGDRQIKWGDYPRKYEGPPMTVPYVLDELHPAHVEMVSRFPWERINRR